MLHITIQVGVITSYSIHYTKLYDLDKYLTEFEQNATKRGIKVYFAKDAQEHNEIVYNILKQNNVKKVVKSKSMLTEECHLNPFLESKGRNNFV